MKYIIFFLGISTFCFSQKISFIYETKYKLNSEKSDDVYSDNMILDLKNNISIFRESQDKKTDSVKLNHGNGRFKMGVENQFYVKKNLAQKRIEKVITYLGTDYFLPIEEILNWKITSEQKIIGKYKSQKAETNYGGRNWIAWFTTDVPFQDGPYKFRGLPGLIVKVEDDAKNYSWELKGNKKIADYNPESYSEKLMKQFGQGKNNLEVSRDKFETMYAAYKKDPFGSIRSQLAMIPADAKMPDGTSMSQMMRDAEDKLKKHLKENSNAIEVSAVTDTKKKK